MSLAALQMARHDDGEKIGKPCPQHVMRRQHGFVLAGMGLGRQQHRAGADLGLKRGQGGFVESQRRGVGLQAAGHGDIPRAQGAKARRDFLVLRQHRIEGGQQRAAPCRGPVSSPAAERAEMRALTSASGMPRAAAARIRLGHRSDSTNRPASGFQ